MVPVDCAVQYPCPGANGIKLSLSVTDVQDKEVCLRPVFQSSLSFEGQARGLYFKTFYSHILRIFVIS